MGHGDLKLYRFVQPGSPISGNMPAVYSAHAIVGEIVKIYADYQDTTATGSIWLAESGAGTELWRKNGFSADQTSYPAVSKVSQTDEALWSGGNLYDRIHVAAPLFVAGSALGTNKLINTVDVYYK